MSDREFIKTGDASSGQDYGFSWLITLNGDEQVWLGLNGRDSIGDMAHVANKLTLDDAEAIGYSLLYAVKLQRDKEEARDDD